MDAIGKLKNERGAALVFIAVGLVVLLALAGLAIDLGYMYVAKGQLQNAADSAALAGAGRLDGTNSFAQYSARNAAVSFAQKNTAAGESVAISSNLSNSQNSSNDVTVGNWNGITRTYIAGGTPVNAVEVRTRRTGSANEVEGQAMGASIGGPVSLFFGKTFGFPKMGASATAVAAKAPSAGFYLFIGNSVCSQTGIIDLTANLAPPSTGGNMAWTSFFDNSTSTPEVLGYLCAAEQPNYEVCGRSLYTTGGTVTPDYRAVKVDFYDPNYDPANKTFDGSGMVTSWTVMVPVSFADDPGLPPAPAAVYGYAKIRIIGVCAPGGPGTNPCSGRPDPPASACNDSYQRIIIDNIQCVSCAASGGTTGTQLRLVQ